MVLQNGSNCRIGNVFGNIIQGVDDVGENLGELFECCNLAVTGRREWRSGARMQECMGQVAGRGDSGLS